MRFDLSQENIETERQRFADFVAFVAAHCADNDELLRRLRENLPADFAFELMGEGSTRRCFAASLGLTVSIPQPAYNG